MNRDELMLRDLDRREETAMLGRVTVSAATHMHVKRRQSNIHAAHICNTNVIACRISVRHGGCVSVPPLKAPCWGAGY